MSTPSPKTSNRSKRSVQEIAETGAAWITESELAWLCQIGVTAQKFVDAYPGGQAGALGNGAARRAHSELRELLAREDDSGL